MTLGSARLPPRPITICRPLPENLRPDSSFLVEQTPPNHIMARNALAKEQFVKLIVGAGQASPSPPVGPALGSKGVKSMDFCKVDTPNIIEARPIY